MRNRNSFWVRFALVFSGSLAGFLLAVGPTARAQNPQDTAISADASEMLGCMSKALLANDFSFESRTLRAYAGPNGELLHIAHKTRTTVRRPDRLLVDATGDDGSTKMFYDGIDLVIYSVEGKQYARVHASGSIEQMLDVAESHLGVDFPLADFLSNDPQKSTLTGITSGGQVGTATIDGVRCRHLFFIQSPDLELELWLEDNDRALPRRLVVTYQSLPGRPRFFAELSNWDFSSHHADTDFVFQPPPGVVQVELASRPGISSSPPAAK
jgi:hypothetical protein